MNEQIKDVNPNAEEISNLEAQIAGIDVNQLDPMDNGKMLVEQETVIQPVETKVETIETKAEESTEDPIKAELDRVKGQTQGKTQKEKFEYKLKRELAQAEEMGIDIAGLAGIKVAHNEDMDEDKPLTRKDLENILRDTKPQSKKAVESALEIENEAERELHLYYLENKVNPSLSEEEKFQTAKDMVNAIKLKNQITLSAVKPSVQSHSTGSSFQPNKQANFDTQKLTPEENYIYTDAQKRGVPITKEDIINMR